MEIKVTTRHGSISSEDKEYVIEKLGKLSHLFNRIEDIEVVFNWEKGNELEIKREADVEIIVNAEHKKDIIAKTKAFSEDYTIRGAFDRAYHKIQSQIHKYKDKITDHHQKEGVKLKHKG